MSVAWRQRAWLLSASICLCAVSQSVLALEKGAFVPPAVDGFILQSKSDGDGDGDGVNETHIMRYRNLSGDRLFSMTTKGKLWAWSLETHAGGDAESTGNYVIRDSNCDGVFDERYGLDDDFHVPDCLK